MKKLFIFFLFLALNCKTNGQETKPENFSFFKLWITNESNEVLLVKWNGSWEIPGTKYNDTLSLVKFLDKMALEMGVKILKPQLAGLLTQRKTGGIPAVLLHYYKTQYSAGAIKVPDDCTDIKWFTYADALKIIPYPMMTDIMQQVTANPGKIIGGAIETYKNSNNITEYRLAEDFYLLN